MICEGDGIIRQRKGIVFFAGFSRYCFISLGLLLCLMGNSVVSAQENPELANKTGLEELELSKSKRPVANSVLLPKGPLVVPVFPRGRRKIEDLPVSTDLRDSYILLEDGSALSVADWILGSLNKDKAGASMSDYENRLFLGQVARAMVGMDEKLVNHSYVYTQPTVSYKPTPPPGPAMQALQGVVSLIGGAIFSGTPEGWHPAKTGGAFSPLQRSGGDAAILFEGQFSGAMLHSVQDIRDTGIYQIMLDDQKAKLKKKAND